MIGVKDVEVSENVLMDVLMDVFVFVCVVLGLML